MENSNEIANKIVKIFQDYCLDKNYQFDKDENSATFIRLNISNLTEISKITIYNTGTIVIGGKKSTLQSEFNLLKKDIEDNPQKYQNEASESEKFSSISYKIINQQMRIKIKEELNNLNEHIEVTNNPSSNELYRSKISSKYESLTITQYNNGTLFLQGKQNVLFHDVCDLVEKMANPSDKEVIVRFISNNEENINNFSLKFTPKLLKVSEENVKNKLGEVYDLLDSHDRKWYVAAECLCIAEIPLPEFSPLVMPASKAFEGFIKKLMIGIKLVNKGYFDDKNANFSPLNSSDNNKRKLICKKDTNAAAMLKRISSNIDVYRHFMMHSSESTTTKVDSNADAVTKVDEIFRSTKETFEYFKGLYPSLLK